MHTLILGLKASSKRLPRLDGVWLSSLVALLGITIWVPGQIGGTLRFLVSSLVYMAPILLIAISIAGWVRASGATSFVANVFSGLIELGMTPGAALAFLVAGGITSLYASVAVIALVRLPVFFAYLGLAIASSFAVGHVYQWIVG